MRSTRWAISLGSAPKVSPRELSLSARNAASLASAPASCSFRDRAWASNEPDGTVAFNFPRDRRTARRLRRLGQHLRLVETRLVGLNCVAHCQRI